MGISDFVGAGIHAVTLAHADFHPAENPSGFGALWHTLYTDDKAMTGHFHICAPDAGPMRWSVSIRNLMPIEDMLLEFDCPGHLSIAWYDSVSGEEFTPYRKLRAHSLWGCLSNESGWRGLVHAGVPVRSVAIEVSPAAIREFLDREFPRAFDDPRRAFACLREEQEIPELRDLLLGLRPKPGEAPHDETWYERRIDEAMRLVVRRSISEPPCDVRSVSPDDRERIFGIASYIDDHYTRILKVPDLARVACMSPTKFKECFKAVTGCTLTQYIQRRRISQAEQMLHQPSLSIEQISHAVGYTCVSRFSELFRRETGLLPSEYRRGL